MSRETKFYRVHVGVLIRHPSNNDHKICVTIGENDLYLKLFSLPWGLQDSMSSYIVWPMAHISQIAVEDGGTSVLCMDSSEVP
jgi:hypothetical protein